MTTTDPDGELLAALASERAREGTIAAVSADDVVCPPADGRFRWEQGGAVLALPLGARWDRPASAQSLVAAWLRGARRLELGPPFDAAAHHLAVSTRRLVLGLAELLGHPQDAAAVRVSARFDAVTWAAHRDPLQAWLGAGRESALPGAADDSTWVAGPSAELASWLPAARELLASARRPLHLEIDPRLLGHDELGRLGCGPPSSGPTAAGPGPEPFHLEAAVQAIRDLGDAAERLAVPFAVKISDGPLLAPLGMPATGASSAETAPARPALAAVVELARRLADRFRARVPLIVELDPRSVDLPALTAAGLAPVIARVMTTTADELAPLGAGLAPLAAALDETGAATLAELGARQALRTAAGAQRFRQRTREHGEANDGACLRDRQWVATWDGFRDQPPDLPIAARIRRAAEEAGVDRNLAARAAAHATGAGHRVALGRYAASLRRGSAG